MTGTDLLEALSFVDEKYIQEAETARLSAKIPWVKVLSVAACLCILITGALALEHIGYKGAKEEAAAPAAPAAKPEAFHDEATPQAEDAPKQETALEESLAESSAETAAGELQHIERVHMYVLKLLEDGAFEAVVADTWGETNPLERDMQVTVVVDPDMVPGVAQTDAVYEENPSEGMQICIENGAYDAEINTLYAAGVFYVCAGE